MAILVAYLSFKKGCFYIVKDYLFSPEHLHVRIMYSVVLKQRVANITNEEILTLATSKLCF